MFLASTDDGGVVRGHRLGGGCVRRVRAGDDRRDRRARAGGRRALRARRHGHGAQRGDRIPPLGDLGGVGELSHRGPPGGLLRRDGRGLGVRHGTRGGRGRTRVRVHERGLRVEEHRPRGRDSGAAGTGRRSTSGPHEEGPAHADLRLCHDGPDLRHQAGQPGLVRRPAPDEAAVLSERVRRERELLGERAADALRRARVAADRMGRAQDRVRVRSLRGQPERRPDDDPPAAGVGRARRFPRRSDEQRLHGRRRLPERGGVLGTQRNGVLPQRPAALDADPGGLEPRIRPGAPRRERRQREVLGPHRAPEHQGALPVPGLHRALPVRGQVGARAARRESFATSDGPTRWRTSSICRTTPSAGVST